MRSVKVEHIEIPMTRELQEFFASKYQGQVSGLVDDFLRYLHTKKRAHEITKGLQDIQQGKTNNIGKLFDEL